MLKSFAFSAAPIFAILSIQASAQSIGTYTEDSGAVRSNIGVGGGIAAGSTDSGNPIKVGGVYSSTLPTLTNGQRGNLQLNPKGAAFVTITDQSGNAQEIAQGTSDAMSTGSLGTVSYVRNFTFNGTSWDRQRGDTNGTVVQPALSSTFWSYAAASGGITNTTTAVTIKAAAGASVRNYLCTLSLSHDTLGAATELAIRDGAAGTVIWRGKLQTTAIEGPMITFTPCLKGTANTLMEAVTLTAVTGGVYANASGYTGS